MSATAEPASGTTLSITRRRLVAPGVMRECSPLRPVRLVVEIQARADGTRPLGDVEEAPDLPPSRQTVPPSHRPHVERLADDVHRTQLREWLDGLRGREAGFGARPIDHRRKGIHVARL